MKDIPSTLVQMLEDEFNSLVHKKDLFANLRHSMTRYATIDEVNAAILQLEEREHASAADTTRPGISSNGKGTVIVGEAHKQQTKQMLIPSDCSLVQSTKQKEAADLEEKQDIKRLVLEYNERETKRNLMG